ncbi:penicillin-binding protein activator [Marilutibacter maris]|uniref:ABC transporter substrate-binding protein n=1 Tax=Marilutibacter maris TaxID=1605891 RepID=A0A2U9T5L3_9GAMM|nr:penicillin-binding protein activator [Lysobacter maris]AWV06477.1 lppc lipoprotein [Lysobacter maris]KAB8183252.1 ABC transporter substrate-binding protein [Lysobacter maris]
MSPKFSVSAAHRFPTRSASRLLAPALAILLLGGCGGFGVRPTAETAVVRNPVVAEADALARGGTVLTGQARLDNERRIHQLLSQLDNDSLAREAAALPPGDALYNYMGQALLDRGLALPRPFDHSAWTFDANNRPPAESDGYRPPVKLAILLPLTGDLAVASSPVRDGFMAGYYGERRRRPEITFYDTTGSTAGTLSAYDRAVTEGNDFVVGPLDRTAVDALFARGSMPVSLLALNSGSESPPPGNASFALSPEDEGIAAAEYLLSRNAGRVLVVSGGEDSQRRMVDALRERLVERGGAVTDVVGEGIADLSPFASREGGVDAVFLAMRGGAARGLAPKLALAGLGGVPRVGTSQLLSGIGSSEEDRALDGIAFPTETWTARGITGLPSPGFAATMLPTARGPAARLFAFGYDAWLLSAYMEKLVKSSDGSIQGATGTLQVDGFGNVKRTPTWATFVSGVVMPLPGGGDRR